MAVAVAAGLPAAAARRDLRALLTWQPLSVDGRVREEAWLRQDRHRRRWGDALIVAAAQAAGCPYLLSEDFQDHPELENLTVVNPFRTRPDELGL